MALAAGLAVVNPDSGPGQSFDSGFADAIQTAHNAGVKVIGYVDTGYFGTTGRQTRSGETSISAWQTQVEQDADTLVTFEGSYADYTDWTPPSWGASASPNQIWHLVYAAADQSQMDQAISLSKSRNAGYVYLTDDILDNPWDTLPSYWTTELSDAG